VNKDEYIETFDSDVYAGARTSHSRWAQKSCEILPPCRRSGVSSNLSECVRRTS